MTQISTGLYRALEEFDAFAVYDSQQWPLDNHSRYKTLIAAGQKSACVIPFDPGMDAQSAWKQAQAYIDQGGRWIFGVLSYDTKNAFEKLNSRGNDATGFPWISLFEPEAVLGITENGVEVYGKQSVIQKIKSALNADNDTLHATYVPPQFSPGTGRDEYLQIVEQIREHIVAGDIYELNYCIEFAGIIEPESLWAMYLDLAEYNRAPMGGYFRQGAFDVLSASPERLLQKNGDLLTAQPMKGTRRRGSSPAEDKQLMEELFHSEKDRAENVMIADLMRNDLSRICVPGTVEVPELFGVYGFSRVYQMITTVCGYAEPGTSPAKVLSHILPPGSMTGAPKIKATMLIEDYEPMRRGAYSGCMGYIDPEGNIDFNVLIRSLVVNRQTAQASFCSGGAIVYDSRPADEFEECMVKAASLMRSWGCD